MPDQNKIEEQRLQKAIRQAQRQIEEIYNQAVLDIAFRAASTKLKGKDFSLSLYKLLEKFIEGRVEKMHRDIYKSIVKSVEKAWSLSNQKNDRIVDKRLRGKIPTKKAKLILYDPNKGALDAFIKRSEKGLDLSKRIWKTLESVPSEIEKSLFVGINEGRSAASLATQMKKHLQDPDRLFRRVREIKGDPNSKLKLSRSAKEYRPGKGKYRSSFKNAHRLTRTETNLAYQNADFERWQNLPFIKGIEVKTSNNHPSYDICDQMEGTFPPDFHFVAWHPNCRCHAVPILVSNEEYNKIELAMLRGEATPPIDKIDSIPERAKRFVQNNSDRIKGWKNVPYFIRNNPQYIGKLLKK